MNKISISPITRVSGLLSIDVFLDPNNRIAAAEAIGEQYRGFEPIMQERKLTDATYLTERICGICSTAHGYTAARLVAQIYGIVPAPEAQRLQQAILGAEFLQNHIRHFYLLALPDYLSGRLLPNAPEQAACRFTPAEEDTLVSHYFQSIDISRKCHEMLSVFGGKIPHQHGMVAEGIAVAPTADRQTQFLGLLKEIRQFITEIMLPDVYTLAEAYQDYFEIGGRPPLYISYGLFDPAYGGFFPSGIYNGNQMLPVNPWEINQSVAYSWFRETNGEVVPDPDKPEGYTWIKAARYHGLPLEGGPLARKAIRSGNPGNHIPNTMDRLIARVEEAALIAGWIEPWIADLPLHGDYITPLGQPQIETAVQYNDAPRGPLLHGVKVNGDVITNYRLITPSVWNFSPKDEPGQNGPVEESLTGTIIMDRQNPVEIGRIVRAFDPCISCGAHVMDMGRKEIMRVSIQ